MKTPAIAVANPHSYHFYLDGLYYIDYMCTYIYRWHEKYVIAMVQYENATFSRSSMLVHTLFLSPHFLALLLLLDDHRHGNCKFSFYDFQWYFIRLWTSGRSRVNLLVFWEYWIGFKCIFWFLKAVAKLENLTVKIFQKFCISDTVFNFLSEPDFLATFPSLEQKKVRAECMWMFVDDIKYFIQTYSKCCKNVK